jgi:hypothetical protein
VVGIGVAPIMIHKKKKTGSSGNVVGIGMAQIMIHKGKKNRFVGDVVGVGGANHDTEEDKRGHLVGDTIEAQHHLSRLFFEILFLRIIFKGFLLGTPLHHSTTCRDFWFLVWVLCWFCVHIRLEK